MATNSARHRRPNSTSQCTKQAVTQEHVASVVHSQSEALAYSYVLVLQCHQAICMHSIRPKPGTRTGTRAPTAMCHARWRRRPLCASAEVQRSRCIKCCLAWISCILSSSKSYSVPVRPAQAFQRLIIYQIPAANLHLCRDCTSTGN